MNHTSCTFQNAQIYTNPHFWTRRQKHLDETRKAKCFKLLQQLAEELSPPIKKVPTTYSGLILRTKGNGFESRLSVLQPILARFLECKISVDWKMITQTPGSISSDMGSGIRATSSKIPKVTLPSPCTDVLLPPKLVRPTSTPISRDIGSSSTKLVLPQRCRDIICQSKFAPSTFPPVLRLDFTPPKTVQSSTCTDVILLPKFVLPIAEFVLSFGLISPMIDSSPECTDVELRPSFILPKAISLVWPQFVLPNSPARQDLGSISTMTKFKLTRVILPPTCLDVVLKIISSSCAPTVGYVGSTFPVPQMRHTKLLMPATCPVVDTSVKFTSPILPPVLSLSSIYLMPQLNLPGHIPLPSFSEIVVPVKTHSPSSQPVDLGIPESASSVNEDPRIQEIRRKVALQVKICEECKARANKAAKALRNAWKRDSKYRRWLKSGKQANKARQAAGDKIGEFRLQEEKVWVEIKKMESASWKIRWMVCSAVCADWMYWMASKSRDSFPRNFVWEFSEWRFSVLSFSFGTNHSVDHGCSLSVSEGGLWNWFKLMKFTQRRRVGLYVLLRVFRKVFMSSVDWDCSVNTQLEVFVSKWERNTSMMPLMVAKPKHNNDASDWMNDSSTQFPDALLFFCLPSYGHESKKTPPPECCRIENATRATWATRSLENDYSLEKKGWS